MPSLPRLRLPRRRPPSLRFSSHEQEWFLFAPDPDQPMVVAGFADAALLAADLTSLPLRHEALVLLDEHRRVTSILLDPPAEVGLFIGRCPPPGAEAPFSLTMTVVLTDDVPVGAPDPSHREAYLALRRLHMAQGLLLLDVLFTDGDTVRSLAIGCDPDPVWFDEFTPSASPPG